MDSQLRRIQRKIRFGRRYVDKNIRFMDDFTDKMISGAIGNLNKLSYEVAKAKLGLGAAQKAKTPTGVLGAITAVGVTIGAIVAVVDKLRRIHGEIRRGVSFWSKQMATPSGEHRGPGRPPLPEDMKKPKPPKRPVGRPRKNS
jgi:hypothetical protein